MRGLPLVAALGLIGSLAGGCLAELVHPHPGDAYGPRVRWRVRDDGSIERSARPFGDGQLAYRERARRRTRSWEPTLAAPGSSGFNIGSINLGSLCHAFGGAFRCH